MNLIRVDCHHLFENKLLWWRTRCNFTTLIMVRVTFQLNDEIWNLICAQLDRGDRNLLTLDDLHNFVKIEM